MWSKDKPCEPGYYWYRYNNVSHPSVIHWDGTVFWMLGTDEGSKAENLFLYIGHDAEFWSEALVAPEG